MIKNVQTTIDFSDYIKDRTRDFSGREWVFSKINDWLQKKERFFLLTGRPGSGKTSLAARLVQMSLGEISSDNFPTLGRDSLTFFHFCQAQNDPTLIPQRFIEALSRQLANKYQPFAQALLKTGDQNITINSTITAGSAESIAGVLIQDLHIANVSTRVAFDRVVRKPLEQLYSEYPNETIVILVDSLDEALTINNDENIMTLISNIIDDPADLPANVRFILTSRPDPRVLSRIGKASLDLIDDSPEGIDDVQKYAYRRLQTLGERKRGELAHKVSSAGRGNFLYARYVLDDLLVNVEKIDDLSQLKLPKGLDGIYSSFLKRELACNQERWEDRYRPLLGILAVAFGEGLTKEQIIGVTGLAASKTDDILRACAQYIVGSKPYGPFRIYHQSFRDFLLKDGDYQIYPAEANQAIANFFLEDYSGRWYNCTDSYPLKYAPAHLMEAVRKPIKRQMYEKLADNLKKLLIDFEFLEAKTDRIGVDAVLADINAVIDLFGLEKNQLDQLVTLRHSIKREIYNLRGWKLKEKPAFFAQQVLLQAKDAGFTQLASIAKARAIQIGKPYLELLWRNGRALPVMTLSKFDKGSIISLTPDSRVISYLSDEIKIWDIKTGQDVHIFKVNNAYVKALSVTSDSSQIILPFSDGTIKIWSLETGNEICTIKGRMNTIAINLDKQLAISASEGTLTVWNLKTGGDVCTFKGYANNFHITPDWNKAIVISNENIKVLNIYTGQETNSFPNNDNMWSDFDAINITPDGQYLVTGSEDGLKFWNLQNGEMVQTIRCRIMVFAVTPDCNKVISGSPDGMVNLWNIKTGKKIGAFSGHSMEVDFVAIAPNGNNAISFSQDAIKVWDIQAGQSANALTAHEGWVNDIVVTSDNSKAISASWDRTIKIWDMLNGQEIRTLIGHEHNVNCVAISPDELNILSGSWDAMVKLWDFRTGQEICTLAGHNDRLDFVAFTLYTQQAISKSQDNKIKIWNLMTRQETIASDNCLVYAKNLSRDGSLAISASVDHNLEVRDLNIGKVLYSINDKNGWIKAVVIASDGNQAISCYNDGKINVWNFKSGEQFSSIASGIHSYIFPDGKHAVSTSMERNLKVWNLESNEIISTIALDDLIFSVTIAPDGKSILAGDGTGNIYCLRYIDTNSESEKRTQP